MINILTYVVVPVLGSFFIMVAMFYFIRQIGTNREAAAWKRRTVAAVYILICIAVSMAGNGILNLLLMFMFPVIGYFFYNNSRLYVMYDIGFVIAVYLTDFLVTLSAGLLQQNLNFYWKNSAYYIGLVISDRVIEFVVLKILSSLIRRKNHDTITRKQLIATLIVPVFSIVLLFSLTSFLEVYLSLANLILLLVDIVILLALNIYVTSLFDTMSQNNRLQRELELYQQQEAFEKKYYENLEQKYQSTRTLVHDIRNHVQMMERLYEEQQNETGIQYTKDIHEILNQLGQKYYTSNKMLNMILNDKVEQMEAKGITSDIKISEVDFSFLRDMDLTIIFGNLLDNAITATEASQEKSIRIRVTTVHQFISITIDNSSDLEPVKKECRFLSHKKGHEALGIKNVERVIAAYQGEIEYEWREKRFITRIMFGI